MFKKGLDLLCFSQARLHFHLHIQYLDSTKEIFLISVINSQLLGQNLGHQPQLPEFSSPFLNCFTENLFSKLKERNFGRKKICRNQPRSAKLSLIKSLSKVIFSSIRQIKSPEFNLSNPFSKYSFVLNCRGRRNKHKRVFREGVR